MNIYQPYEIGLNYINISGGGPFLLGPDLVAAGFPKRCGPAGNYAGGTSQGGGSPTSFTLTTGSNWGATLPGFAGTNLYNGILTWQPGAQAVGSYYFKYNTSTKVFTIAPSMVNAAGSAATPAAGDVFIITTIYGQVRWRLKQLSLEYVSGSVTMFSVTDTKASAVIMSGGVIASGPPLVMGPTDSNNGLCETINFGYGMTMTLTGGGSVSGSAAVEACGPLWATGDSLAG